ncbi:MAG: hypothetical protein JOS17DRAFT_158783 [Linnemannia elongata]|nr:MAG: hypothetical protein JOS17DRAFT_158783 [Linnemannia elongata]
MRPFSFSYSFPFPFYFLLLLPHSLYHPSSSLSPRVCTCCCSCYQQSCVCFCLSLSSAPFVSFSSVFTFYAALLFSSTPFPWYYLSFFCLLLLLSTLLPCCEYVQRHVRHGTGVGMQNPPSWSHSDKQNEKRRAKEGSACIGGHGHMTSP